MKTFITGAAGFVGSAVLRKLLEAGQQVRALARPNSDQQNLSGLNVEIVTGDLGDPATFDHALDGCDALYHIAADYRLWVPNPKEMYKSNVEGTVNIMKAAQKAGVKRIVYTSSVATLGINSNGTPADETTPVSLDDMIGHYKRSKFLAEAEVSKMVQEQGLPAVIVNPSTPIGPRDVRCTPTGQMIIQAASGNMPAYVDTGLNIVHVDDVAEGHLLAYDRGIIGERYILGGTDMTLKEILTELSYINGSSIPRIRLPHNLILPVAYVAEYWAKITNGGEPLVTVDGVRLAKKRMFFSSEKAKRELGYQPRPAVEALKDAVTWFQDNGCIH